MKVHPQSSPPFSLEKQGFRGELQKFTPPPVRISRRRFWGLPDFGGQAAAPKSSSQNFWFGQPAVDRSSGKHWSKSGFCPQGPTNSPQLPPCPNPRSADSQIPYSPGPTIEDRKVRKTGVGRATVRKGCPHAQRIPSRPDRHGKKNP